MKKSLIIILFLITTGLLRGQSYFEFVDKETGEKLKEYSTSIVLDGYIDFASLRGRSGSYIYSFQPWAQERSDSYKGDFYLSINKAKYYPAWIPIDLNSKDTLTVILDPDPNYIHYQTTLIYQGCGEPMYDQYYPRPFRSLNDLPDQLSEKIRKELINRVGPDNFERLYTSSIYRFNGTEALSLMKKDSFREGEIGYRICLSFSEIPAGIAQYSTDFYVTAEGLFLSQPQLPFYRSFLKSPKSWELLTYAEIQEIAKMQDVKFESINPTFEYYQRGNTFAWIFEEKLGVDENGFDKSKSTYLDALTGKILAVFYDEGLSMTFDN